MAFRATVLKGTTMKSRRRQLIDNFEARSVGLFGALIFAASMAHAQAQAPAAPSAAGADNAKMTEAFDRADKNRDGSLTKDEADSLPAVAQRFEQIDSDKNGAISKKEFEEAVKP
jgi:EF hand